MAFGVFFCYFTLISPKNLHIKTLIIKPKYIFETKELEELSVVSILETTATDYKKYETKFYQLEAILALGYRVNFTRAIDSRN